MSNVHGLFSGKEKDDKDKKDDNDDDENNRYVGGIGDRGGGSGLAVQPNTSDEAGGSGGNARDQVFGLAQNAAADEREQVRRTITMYRDGFQVDDGPYRRLNDPANAEFLRALAQGRTPRELVEDGNNGNQNVVVGLVDKRSEDFVETFQSFSGTGTSLGSGDASSGAGGADGQAAGVFDPSTLPEPSAAAAGSGGETTSIAVRTLSSGRRVVRLALNATVQDLAAQVGGDAGGASFSLVAGYPPKPLTDPNQSIEDAGLKGAQVSMKKQG